MVRLVIWDAIALDQFMFDLPIYCSVALVVMGNRMVYTVPGKRPGGMSFKLIGT